MEMNKEMKELGADMLDKVTGGASVETMLAGEKDKFISPLNSAINVGIEDACHASADVLGASLRGGKVGLIKEKEALSESILDGNVPLP